MGCQPGTDQVRLGAQQEDLETALPPVGLVFRHSFYIVEISMKLALWDFVFYSEFYKYVNLFKIIGSPLDTEKNSICL